jgi:hypothetical protein
MTAPHAHAPERDRRAPAVAPPPSAELPDDALPDDALPDDALAAVAGGAHAPSVRAGCTCTALDGACSCGGHGSTH